MNKQEITTCMETFESLCRFVEQHTAEQILGIVSELFEINPTSLMYLPMGGYSRINNEDGSLTKGNGCYRFVLQDLQQNLNEYRLLYSRLHDDTSRNVLLNQLRYRLVPSDDFLRAAYTLSKKYPQYFDKDIFELGNNEVFIDCGGNLGDSTEMFIKQCKNFKHIYVYEPLPENVIKCEKNLAKYSNITIRQAGVGRKSSKTIFSGEGSSGSFDSADTHSLNEYNSIDIVSLDDDVKEKVTFIKMDIECFEPDAIRGASEHIKKDSPKLAICLYHMVSDLWEIPKLINEINPNYHYYIRHYNPVQNWEYVLYAIPANQPKINRRSIENHAFNHIKSFSDLLSETYPYMEQIDSLSRKTAVELYEKLEAAAKAATTNRKKIDPEIRTMICDRLDRVLERVIDLVPSVSLPNHTVCTPAVLNYMLWSNVGLMKDGGLAVYTLANEIGGHPLALFGTKPSDYPYLSYLPDMEMLYHDPSLDKKEAYYKHLQESYPDLDVLLFCGMYEMSIEYLNAYRQLRPDGKVYCGLDMNRFWMDKIPWDNPNVTRFAEQCDIVATSCRSLRDALNRNPNVTFPCRWLTNGFYNPTGQKITADPLKKENVVLTVGRIGTAQKNNEELLIAFAKIADRIRDWTIRLVGSIEPEFQTFISSYFETYPQFKDRVIFTGSIEDKYALYSEYSKAKIFILTSRMEGGTPNVYAEALHHGCMFITSDIDAADDITNYGELGVTYKSGDIDALATALMHVCTNADERMVVSHIPKALDYAAKYYDWNRNAKKLAHMLWSPKKARRSVNK